DADALFATVVHAHHDLVFLVAVATFLDGVTGHGPTDYTGYRRDALTAAATDLVSDHTADQGAQCRADTGSLALGSDDVDGALGAAIVALRGGSRRGSRRVGHQLRFRRLLSGCLRCSLVGSFEGRY